MTRFFRFATILATGCVFAANGCLPDNFWSSLAGDTVIAGATATVVDFVVTSLLPA